MTLGFLGAFLVAAWRPELVLYCISGANVAVIANLVLVRLQRPVSP